MLWSKDLGLANALAWPMARPNTLDRCRAVDINFSSIKYHRLELILLKNIGKIYSTCQLEMLKVRGESFNENSLLSN